MRDPYLTAIIERVERSGDPVRVSLVLQSGAVVTGYVRQSDSSSNSRAGVQTQSGRRCRHRRTITRRACWPRRNERKLPSTLCVVSMAGAEVDHVTLSDVTMVWSSGDGLRLEVVRISLDAIAGWWITPGQAIKGRTRRVVDPRDRGLLLRLSGAPWEGTWPLPCWMSHTMGRSPC